MKHLFRLPLFGLLGIFAVCSPAIAQESSPAVTGYRTPSAAVAAVVLAPPTPLVSASPDRALLLIEELPSFPPISELAERELRLAGIRWKPQINGPSRSRPFTGLRFRAVADGAERAVTGLPAGARIENVRWSPDGRYIAFTNTTATGIELWTAETATGKAKRLTGPVVSLVADIAPAWLADGQSLVCVVVPEKRGPEPVVPSVPAGPVVQENMGKTAPNPTYQDLLQNANDEVLFEHYFTVQIARVTVGGKMKTIGEPGVLWHVEPSPDGAYLLVETLHRPYSYLVPAERFPVRVEIRTVDGKVVRQIADLPLQEEIPIANGSVAQGPREFVWRADAPATLCWAEAQDGGDAGRVADVRDKVFLLEAPFAKDPVLLATLALRYGDTTWGRNDLAVVSEWWWKTRTQRQWIVSPAAPATPPRKLFEYSWEDRYHDPGNLVTEPNAYGERAILFTEDGKSAFLIGAGASDEGDRPFLDRLDLASLEVERLFRSEAPYYESPALLLDRTGTRILTRRETVDEPPNFYVRDLQGGEPRAVTAFPHPTPQLRGVQKEIIRYTRQDGVQLTGTLYLPPGYKTEQGPLPMVMWAYPEEFKSADAAGQVTDSPYRFARVSWSSPLVWLAKGYAVLDHPSMPIVGEGDAEPNDTYVPQLVASAQAAVDEVVRRGVTERGRIAVGGHSYGAFMTANLLAHTDLFAAGIARSGAYNRTLTPFGFQSEERTLWQAPEVYMQMSPFLHADKINEPLLLIHGEADNNSGTFPMQSERLYAALKGHGATARLVMLPLESHSYRAQESILHMLWETEEWLDRYVRPARPSGEE